MDKIFRHLIFFSVFLICSFFYLSGSGAAELKGIFSDNNPSRLRLQVSGRIPSKVILVDDKELLIALKNIRPAKGMKKHIKSSGFFKKIEIEELTGNVLAVLVTGQVSFEKTSSAWDDKGLNFTVSFTGKTASMSSSATKGKPASAPGKVKTGDGPAGAAVDKLTSGQGQDPGVPDPLTQKSQDPIEKSDLRSDPSLEKRQITDTSKIRIAKKAYGSRSNIIPDMVGDISGMIVLADLMKCSDNDLKKASLLLKQAQWSNAYDLLNGYIENGSSVCREKVELLRAYAYYKTIEKDDFRALLQAESLFQSVLVQWPDSSMVPFSHAALGLIYGRLSNTAASEGHLTIVMNEYKDYSGIPEVFYHLAKIYGQKGYNEKALNHYREVFEKYPDSIYAVDAGVGFGKALFKKRHYIDSRDILTALLKTNPEIMFESPEVLLSIGDAEYALGYNEPARNTLSKAYNLFAGIPDKDMIMTRIGDTYVNEKNLDRAKKVYEFVMDRFPGTEGFLGSAMGLALCLKDRTEVEDLYNMVKKDFADHRLARVAMMRLAELYNKEGEYAKCIQEIETLLATHPTGLRYDAVKLMQKAYESLFEEQRKNGQYPEVLRTYEGAKVLLDRLESRKIFLTTGLSYLDGHLHEQAFNQLLKAYKLYEESERSSELLFGMGVAMDETGRDDEALNVLKSYTEKFKDAAGRVDAFVRMGDIFFQRGELKKSAQNYGYAYQFCKERIQKGGILNREAEIHKSENDWDKVAELLKRAVTEYASAPGENYHLISEGYKALGKSYLELQSFVKAADAFSLALKFSDNAGDTGSDIAFMLGDAYQKANILEKAKETFEKVAEGEDSIWSRLARERLSTLMLAENLSNS